MKNKTYPSVDTSTVTACNLVDVVLENLSDRIAVIDVLNPSWELGVPD